MGEPDPAPPTRAETTERFMAFAFAAAEMVAETDASGHITFAAGAFRSMFGHPAEAFIGRHVHDLVAPSDHDGLETALAILSRRGRLSPVVIRMANDSRTALALGGMARASDQPPRRLCLSFATPPLPSSRALSSTSAHDFARRAEALLKEGPASIDLIEISAAAGQRSGADVIQRVLTDFPDGVAAELTPGRFGLLGTGAGNLAALAGLLDSALRARGIESAVTPQRLPLALDGLTPVQAARALRQALSIFARDGSAGMSRAGFTDGLAGYVRQAGANTKRLRRAIREGYFHMAFQPIVSLFGRNIHHYEALIRPKQVEGCDFASPQEFVLLVESLGLADELDLAVAGASCAAAHRAGLPVAFNLSGQTAQNPISRKEFITLLTESPARKAGLISIEMTETADIDDMDEVLRTAQALRELKIPFCLDDFGAGAADMRMLRALPVDIVKLDGCYVPGIATDPRARSFVAGMVEMARSSGASVVAERVETEAEAAALAELGVHYGQGFLFGRPQPLPAPAAPPIIARRGGAKESWG